MTVTMEERKATRVFGVGVGVFLLAFFSIFCMLLCCAGTLTDKPRKYYRRAMFIWLVVILYLFTADKQTQFVTKGETIKDYNDMYDVRIGLGVFFVMSTLYAIKKTLVSILFDKIETETFDEEVPTRRTFF